MDDALHIEEAAFWDLQYIKKVWYYSEILSGIHTTFEQVDEKYSSCAFDFHFVFGSRERY